MGTCGKFVATAVVAALAACGGEPSTGDSLPGTPTPVRISQPEAEPSTTTEVPPSTTPEEGFGGEPAPGSVVAVPPELCATPGSIAGFEITNPTDDPTGFSYTEVLTGQNVQYVVGLWPVRPQLHEVPEGSAPTLPPQALSLLRAGGSVELALLAPATTGDYTLSLSHGVATVILRVSTDCATANATEVTT